MSLMKRATKHGHSDHEERAHGGLERGRKPGLGLGARLLLLDRSELSSAVLVPQPQRLLAQDDRRQREADQALERRDEDGKHGDRRQADGQRRFLNDDDGHGAAADGTDRGDDVVRSLEERTDEEQRSRNAGDRPDARQHRPPLLDEVVDADDGAEVDDDESNHDTGKRQQRRTGQQIGRKQPGQEADEEDERGDEQGRDEPLGQLGQKVAHCPDGHDDSECQYRVHRVLTVVVQWKYVRATGRPMSLRSRMLTDCWRRSL